MDSKTTLNPPKTLNKFRYFPTTESSGSKDMAMKRIPRGVKQATKVVEIMTTILATFWLRLDTLSVCEADVDSLRHFALLCSFTTSVIVQTMITRNAENGVKILITA